MSTSAGQAEYMTFMCWSIPHFKERWKVSLFFLIEKGPLVELIFPSWYLVIKLIQPYHGWRSLILNMHRWLVNYRQSRAHIIVENAFGHLKGRWRCLLKCLDCHVASCVVLHNLCKMFGDKCLADWVEHQPCPPHPSGNTEDQSSPNLISDAVAQYLLLCELGQDER